MRALALALLILFATAPTATPLAPMTAHPWRGEARVCVLFDDQRVGCGQLEAREMFDSEAECRERMISSLTDLRAFALANRRIIDYRAEYRCSPAREAWNA